MTTFLLVSLGLSISALFVFVILKRASDRAAERSKLEATGARLERDQEIARARADKDAEIERFRVHYQNEAATVRTEAEAVVAFTRDAFERKLAELDAE